MILIILVSEPGFEDSPVRRFPTSMADRVERPWGSLAISEGACVAWGLNARNDLDGDGAIPFEPSTLLGFSRPIDVEVITAREDGVELGPGGVLVRLPKPPDTKRWPFTVIASSLDMGEFRPPGDVALRIAAAALFAAMHSQLPDAMYDSAADDTAETYDKLGLALTGVTGLGLAIATAANLLEPRPGYIVGAGGILGLAEVARQRAHRRMRAGLRRMRPGLERSAVVIAQQVTKDLVARYSDHTPQDLPEDESDYET